MVSLPIRNAGAGLAMIRGVGVRLTVASPAPPWMIQPANVPAGERGRVSFRTTPGDAAFAPLTQAIEAHQSLSIEVGYSDLAGQQYTVSRFDVYFRSQAHWNWEVRQVHLQELDGEQPFAGSVPTAQARLFLAVVYGSRLLGDDPFIAQAMRDGRVQTVDVFLGQRLIIERLLCNADRVADLVESAFATREQPRFVDRCLRQLDIRHTSTVWTPRATSNGDTRSRRFACFRIERGRVPAARHQGPHLLWPRSCGRRRPRHVRRRFGRGRSRRPVTAVAHDRARGRP